MSTDFRIRHMLLSDKAMIKHVINLSFPIFYRYFATHSLHEEGQVLVSETAGNIFGFAKLIDFCIGNNKYGCILWIAVHPTFRRKGIAASLTYCATQFLKQGGALAVFASTQRRNVAALSALSLQGFRKMSFLDLWRIFGWRSFEFYRDIWFAPGEILLMHT